MLIPLEKVLSHEEAAAFRDKLLCAAWNNGLATAGTLAGSVKKNLQLDDNDPLSVDLGNRILRRLGQHPGFISAALPAAIYPPKFNCYQDGGHYGLHIDSAMMAVPGTAMTVRTDVSCTLFLSDAQDYDGGELEIEGPFGVQQVKLDAGDLILYPSTSLHRVAPVTRGARIASFFWVQSMVADPTQRATLFDLDQAIQGITPRVEADNPELLKLTTVYHNLLRQWGHS